MSRGEIAPDSGSRALALATPAVIFSWVKDAACSSPEGDEKNDIVNMPCGSRCEPVRIRWK